MSRLGFDATFENIEKLCDIVDSRELEELSIKEKNDDGSIEITIKGKKCPPPPPAAIQAAPTVQQAASAPAAAENTAAFIPGNAVKAPIVGTFYAAPSPKDKPFVAVGQQVHKGDVLFIIESMKVMSEIQSDFDGVVKEICVNDGESVEYDQTIMIIG